MNIISVGTNEWMKILYIYIRLLNDVWIVLADPHIKVVGMKDAVAAARDKILTVLDTKVCVLLYTNLIEANL